MSPPSLRLQPLKYSPNFSISASACPSYYDLNAFKFDPIKESIVSREMTRRYTLVRYFWKCSSKVFVKLIYIFVITGI